MRYLCIVIIVAFCQVSYGQKKTYAGLPSVNWPKLYNITYKNPKAEWPEPQFSAEVKNLEGKIILLPGYIIPFETGQQSNHFILSSLPINACFFCGVGGPESVIEIYSINKITYTEKPVEFRGVLRLNASNPDKMIYILEKAEFLGESGF